MSRKAREDILTGYTQTQSPAGIPIHASRSTMAITARM